VSLNRDRLFIVTLIIRLADSAAIFSNRRKELALALSIHTTLGVDTANVAIRDVRQSVNVIEEKLNLILLFRKLETPQEKELMKQVDARGGVEACLDDDEALQELMTISQKRDNRNATDETELFAQVKKELMEDIEQILEKNMVIFERKLAVQVEQLIAGLTSVVQREGDRVISAINAGSHDRIIDPVSNATANLLNLISQWSISGLTRHVGGDGML
jgi:hypothetical protein